VKRRYLTIDVFTDRLFSGNQVAVVLDAQGLSTRQMREIANEFNYSETTFVIPPKQPEHTAWVRIFTPHSELPFAGHPNVGTAFALAAVMADRDERPAEQFVFEEGAGLVPVSLMREDGAVTGAELLAPEPLTRRGVVAPDWAAACLSLSAEDILVDEHQPQVFSVGLPFLVVKLASRDALRRAAPNPSAFNDVLPVDGARSVYASFRTPSEAGSDILSRMFTEHMTEDPATGSATAATAAMLAQSHKVPDGETVLRFMQASIWAGRACLLRVFSSEQAPSARCVLEGAASKQWRGASIWRDNLNDPRAFSLDRTCYRAKSTAAVFAPHSSTATPSSLGGRYRPDVNAARAAAPPGSTTTRATSHN